LKPRTQTDSRRDRENIYVYVHRIGETGGDVGLARIIKETEIHETSSSIIGALRSKHGAWQCSAALRTEIET
jgi:hypothetical protein